MTQPPSPQQITPAPPSWPTFSRFAAGAGRKAWTALLLWCCTFLLPAGVLAAVQVTDDDGISHRLERTCSRIISLYPAHTENLAAMGAADALLGISTSDTEPPSILGKARFSMHDTAEKFIAAEPDCILIRPMIKHSKPNLVQQLQRYGIAVISLQPTTAEELYAYWQALGTLSGRSREADRMIERFTDALAELRRRTTTIPHEQRPRVYFEAIHQRMRTFSPESIALFCLEAAGGVNIADDAVARRGTNIADYSKERILAKADHIDVFLAQSGRMNRITVEELTNEPGFGAIKAIRTGRVHLIDEDLVARPTPRLLEGIELLNRLLYP